MIKREEEERRLFRVFIVVAWFKQNECENFSKIFSAANSKNNKIE